MMKIPAAAKVLRSQMGDKGILIPAGDPDGFGVYRTVEFDEHGTEWLATVSRALVEDERVESIDASGDRTQVTFVASTKADDRSPFPVEAAEEVAAAEEPKPVAKKAASKRAAKKA